MGRRIESEREARRCLSAARAAGQSAGEWAREHGIDGRSLNAWRVNLARGRRELQLVELVPAVAASECRYLVRVGGVAVEIGDDFREETVVRLVRALRSC